MRSQLPHDPWHELGQVTVGDLDAAVVGVVADARAEPGEVG